MIDMDKYILELFQKMENGAIEPYEKEILIEWINSNADAKDNYLQFMKEDWSKLSVQLDSSRKSPKSKIRRLYKWSAVAASLLAVLAFTFLFFTKSTSIEVYASNSTKEVILPDQSVVTLNKSSFLKYDNNFGKSNRDLILKGSAYFNVTRNKKLPFVIQTKTAKTRVIGTAFYLEESEKDSLVLLDVDEGIVSIQVDDNNAVIRKVGEKYSYNKLTKTISDYSIPINDKYWKTNKLVFDNTPLNQALVDISKAFDVSLSFKNDISKCRLTSTFESEKFDDLLDILAITYQGKWETIDKKAYVLTNTNCK